MNKAHAKPLNWSMMLMLTLGWLIPLILITFSVLYPASNTINNQIERTIRISTSKAIEICEMKLDENLYASKKVSYDYTVYDSYKDYCRSGAKEDFVIPVTNYLDQQYKYDHNFLSAMIFLIDEPDNFCFTYNTYKDNNRGNAGYKRVQRFISDYREKVLDEAARLDTRTELMVLDNHFYMVRNLVDSSFNPYAMIVIEVSPVFTFDSLNSVWGAADYEVYLDGVPIFGNGCGSETDIQNLAQSSESGYLTESNNRIYSYKVLTFEGHRILCVIRLDSQVIIDDVEMLRSIMVMIIMLMIPLVIMVFWFFHIKVSKPVADLVDASREIAGGNYGHQVAVNGGSKEFDYLDEAFNIMSIELKHQFEQIYLEELALKDAKIKALQSQINPHFLNNTLEIINWEARLSGNDKISGMIEALATMLNATMNRRHRKYITLAEELEYVDAYLYIIKQRLGDRFEIEREIDESLLKVEVPLLIIQPVVENAVEHGVQGRKHGKVLVRIYEKDQKMYIEVINDGPLSEEDKTKIAYLLGDDFEESKVHYVSLGIRNVNKRLRIIYGDDCGLFIKTYNNNQTISTIIVKMNKDNNKSQ